MLWLAYPVKSDSLHIAKKKIANIKFKNPRKIVERGKFDIHSNHGMSTDFHVFVDSDDKYTNIISQMKSLITQVHAIYIYNNIYFINM